MPPADAIPQFELVTFGDGNSQSNPDKAGFAFFLIAGSDTAVSSMSKRDNPGLHFLDCPANLLDHALETQQTVRIVCLSGPTKDCFGVEKGGVEGTVVKMPDNCGNGTYTRAISLKPSRNQTLPTDLANEGLLSDVYDFTFDYNMGAVRRDAGTLSIRMDYSNVPGYWSAVVAGGPKFERRLSMTVKRFFASQSSDWFKAFDGVSFDPNNVGTALPKQDLAKLLYYNGKKCQGDNGVEGQGLAAAITGRSDVRFFQGFSLIATWDPAGSLNVHQSAGFLRVAGETTAYFTVAGIGKMDAASQSSDMYSHTGRQETLGGHSIFHGWAGFTMYAEQQAYLETDSEDGSEVGLNGYMQAQTKTYWNERKSFFPSQDGEFKARKMEVATKDRMTPMSLGSESTITLTNAIQFGFYATLNLGDGRKVLQLPDMSVKQQISASFTFTDKKDTICLDTTVSSQELAVLDKGSAAGWSDDDYESPISQVTVREKKSHCWDNGGGGLEQSSRSGNEDAESITKTKKDKRQNNSFPPSGDYRGLEGIPDLTYLINKEVQKEDSLSWTCAAGCGYQCYGTLDVGGDCCDCAWLPPGSDDLTDAGLVPSVEDGDLLPGLLDPPIGAGPDTGISKRSPLEAFVYGISPAHDLWGRANSDIGKGRKSLKFWRTDIMLDDNYDSVIIETDLYPQYPDWYRNPTGAASWESAPAYTTVKKYFHNSTSTCTSFDVAQFARHDVMYPWPQTGHDGYAYKRGTAYHGMYDTEHVFEAQTVVRFFDKWLSENAATRRYRYWVEENFFVEYVDFIWIHRIVDELGSIDNMDRLTVFMKRPNQNKGRLFKDSRAMSMSTFGELEKGPEQLLAAREVGLIFPYLNHDEVWESFCDTYNGVLDHLVDFDSWYETKTGAPSNLRGEWPRFIRSELDMVVRKARLNVREMNLNRKSAGARYTGLWATMMGVNGEMRKVKLERTDHCRNLPASTAGVWTGP